MSKILIVDQSRGARNTLRERLEFEGYNIESASDNIEASELCRKVSFNIIITEHSNTPRYDDNYNNTPFIVLSSDCSVESAMAAARNGALDYLSKPVDMNKLLKSVRDNLFEVNNRNNEPTVIVSPKFSSVKTKHHIEPIIGQSLGLEKVRNLIDKVAPSDARVLVTGENGTGKELVAQWLHAKSRRNAAPFVEVNCAAIPSELIESELFGHEKGAFTSAIKQRKGKFELANGGTLFLDEIGDMSLSAQAKVLRALQENRITRVGGDKDTSVNVRIIVATNRNLKDEIAKGNFREDLYHRFGVIVIKVPPLREHSEDIPLLVSHFIDKLCQSYNIPSKIIEHNAVKLLQDMPWSGNVRELRNVIERLIILSDGGTITANDVREYC